ncbi:hypothetical protein KPH14_012760 [Odynerus spinipes]|uniref:Uncharacterized protein n=1 Tax=Odynerus spinipes TaxID=1348599 RepID=A0AAD9R9D1_9HYME|nr:hypothetical protein KPH14_012760 [Odynerus spinipes]
MHRVDLPEVDKIQLLVDGIQHTVIKTTALGWTEDRLDSFLDKMRRVTQGSIDIEGKPMASGQSKRPKDDTCRNCGKKGHNHKDCRAEVSCFYCKSKGHRRYDCPTLKMRQQRPSTGSYSGAEVTAAAVDTETSLSSDLVAAVQEPPLSTRLELVDPLIHVYLHLKEKKPLVALVDTGSPVSFIKASVYFKFVESSKKLSNVAKNLRSLTNDPLDILGLVDVELSLAHFENRKFPTTLWVTNSDAFQGDLILGREFFKKGKLVLVYDPTAKSNDERVNLLANLPLCVEDSGDNESIEAVMQSQAIDFGQDAKERLIKLVVEMSEQPETVVEDDYAFNKSLRERDPAAPIAKESELFQNHFLRIFRICKCHRIKHRKVAVAAPWANRLAERVNRFLKSSLTKLVDSPDEWKSKLGEMQYIINNTYHSAIKTTPAKLMLGYDQKNHADYPLAHFTRALADVDPDLENERQNSRDSALQATELIRAYNKQYKDKRSNKPTVYKEGDYVLIRDTTVKAGVNSKLKPHYKGPYLVAKSLGSNRYVIKDIPGFNLTQKPLDTILSSDRMKPWVKIGEPAKEIP